MHRIIKYIIIKVFTQPLKLLGKKEKRNMRLYGKVQIRGLFFKPSLSKYAFQQRLLGLLKVLFVSADVAFLCCAVFPKWVIQNRRGEERGVFSPAHSFLSFYLSLFGYRGLIRHPSSTSPQSLLCTALLVSIPLSHE